MNRQSIIADDLRHKLNQEELDAYLKEYSVAHPLPITQRMDIPVEENTLRREYVIWASITFTLQVSLI